MNTRQMQIYKLSNDVLIEFITNGTYPLAGHVIKEVLRRASGRVIGTPFTLYRHIKYREPTDANKYYSFFSEASDDIELLYNMLADTIRRLIIDMDYQLTWRARVINKVRETERALNTISNGYVFTEHFNNMRDIDVSDTTAFVNLKESAVTLPERNRDSMRIYPDISNVSVTADRAAKDYGSIDNIFDDSYNTFWLKQISVDNDSVINITINIQFVDAISCNKIFIAGFGPRDTSVSVTLHADNEIVVLDERIISSYRNTAYYIETTDIDAITLVLTKNKSDYTDNNKYIYDFGLQSLEFYSVKYMTDTAEVISERIGFKDIYSADVPINVVTLSADYNEPSGTSCKFYVSVTNNDTPQNWLLINNNEPFVIAKRSDASYSLSTIERYSFDSRYANELFWLRGNGFVSLPLLHSDVQLKRDNEWLVQYYYYDDEEATLPMPDQFVATGHRIYTYWRDSFRLCRIPASRGYKRSMVMFTTYFYATRNETIECSPVPLYFIEKQKRVLYLNGSAVHTEKYSATQARYVLNIIEGWNRLSYVTNDYMPDDKHQIDACISYVRVTYGLTCSRSYMHRVNIYDLAYRARQSDTTKYAISNDNKIVVLSNTEARYALSYKYINSSDASYNIFYRATVSTTDANSTPVINSIKLVVNK